MNEQTYCEHLDKVFFEIMQHEIKMKDAFRLLQENNLDNCIRKHIETTYQQGYESSHKNIWHHIQRMIWKLDETQPPRGDNKTFCDGWRHGNLRGMHECLRELSQWIETNVKE